MNIHNYEEQVVFGIIKYTACSEKRKSSCFSLRAIFNEFFGGKEMPKTKFQDAVFSVMMVCVMVYAMEVYNIALTNGGMTNAAFLQALKDLPMMAVIALVLEKLIAGRFALKLAAKLFTPGEGKPIFFILEMGAFTVCMMCPMMSCVATLLYKHAGSQFVAAWVQTAATNFLMALCWQIFFAGPLVRFLFRHLFRKQLETDGTAVDGQQAVA